MSLSTADLVALRPLEDQLNAALKIAASVVAEIRLRGGDVTMRLEDADRPGNIVRAKILPSAMQATVGSR